VKEKGARPPAAPFFFALRNCAGWTLIELTVVLAVAAVLIFFAVRNFRPQEALALQQAERLRNDIRSIQMLAITWNQALRVTTIAAVPGPDCPNLPAIQAQYEVRCVSGSATAPCNGVNPVINPATGQAYRIRLECGLDIAGPGFTMDFDALGRPKNGANFIAANAVYNITGGGAARGVTVLPATGFASVQ
jgi:prepilin-type N-terminal cleavage/methylation domain-containing protein